jgi:galactofuranose transport system permease protein
MDRTINDSENLYACWLGGGFYNEGVGINGSASRLVDLNSRVIKFMAFVICGILAGLVGSSSVGSVNSGELGLGREMDAILAVALGGNLLSGGKFSITGSVIGAYTIQAITTTLYAMNVRGLLAGIGGFKLLLSQRMRFVDKKQ